MTAVETMRAAAEKLRERAQAAVDATGDEPWQFDGLGYSVTRQAMTYEVTNADKVAVCAAVTEGQAEYIAAVGPAVGLAVAAVLEDTAEYMRVVDMSDDDAEKIYGEHMDLARAVLGESGGGV